MTTKDYINQFWRLNEIRPFSQHETWLYFYLLNQWFENGQEEWFNPKLLPKLLPKMLLKRCRDKLIEIGLIAYQKGERRSVSPSYKICCVTYRVTKTVTKRVTNKKEEIPPTPPKEEKIEREKENISKDIQKKEESGLSFCLPSYMPIMEEWLEYKKEKKQKYTDMGIRACYHNLVKLSNNSPEIAKLIVEQSIANNWAGLFELKTNGRTQENFRTTSRPGFNNFDEAESKQVGRINSIEL